MSTNGTDKKNNLDTFIYILIHVVEQLPLPLSPPFLEIIEQKFCISKNEGIITVHAAKSSSQLKT